MDERIAFNVQQDGASLSIERGRFGTFFVTAFSGAHEGMCELTYANALRLRDWLNEHVK